ncbi:hypothetical protein LAZ67_22000866 [Cordylochernes scorpioides]|uniref:Reverse transcriptase Ty1/copia-type domain-containing protein n=1 Tax=Cordylochernes scorpioides TaxID=51811 RepID=A0ABY6LQZ4_9ARAC|nr:hypothetical protein LAZ67_22000866 [Cordylochernes scorpioides]
MQYDIKCFDIVTAYLYGNLEETIYMKQPEGFEEQTPCAAAPNMEYKRLQSCIPGLGALIGYYQPGQLSPGFLVSLLLLLLLLFHPGLGPTKAE